MLIFFLRQFKLYPYCRSNANFLILFMMCAYIHELIISTYYILLSSVPLITDFYVLLLYTLTYVGKLHACVHFVPVRCLHKYDSITPHNICLVCSSLLLVITVQVHICFLGSVSAASKQSREMLLMVSLLNSVDRNMR